MLNPHEVSKPEGFCVACDGFTTNHRNGECSECKTELMFEDVEQILKSRGIDKGILIAALGVVDISEDAE